MIIVFLLLSFLIVLSTHTKHTMQNEAGMNVDLYIPRKCSWTSRLVHSKDHAAVQINVAKVDPISGMALAENDVYCLAGYVRFKSESDMALTSLVSKKDTDFMMLVAGGDPTDG
jgi:small subunit ribosomal protein S21e